MKKYLFLLFSIIASTCFANDKLITYADFVTMPKEKQVKTIQMVHDFLAEVEKQQNWYMRGQPKYQTYIKIINFFMNSAVASNDLFDKIKAEHKCYYGGWISFIRKTPDGRALCVHPKKIELPVNKKHLANLVGIKPYDENKFKNTDMHKFFIQNISKKYKESTKKSVAINFDKESGKVNYAENQSSCSQKSSLPCNPDIYGTKNGATFCITSVEDRGLNAAYLCQKALEELDTVEKEKALDDIIQNGISRDSNLFSGLKTMYDTCLCGGNIDQPNSGHLGSINSQYANKIFISRTCAGILNQTQTIKETFLTACEQETFSTDDNLKSWKNYLQRLDGALNDKLKRIADQHTKLNGLDKVSISASEVDQYFKEDQKIFESIAKENYQVAKENKLCPVLTNIPALTLVYNNKTKNLELELINATETQKAELKDISIAHTKIDENETIASSDRLNPPMAESTDQKQDAGSYVHLFSVKTVADDSNAVAQAILNGIPLSSNNVIIPGEVQVETKASCSIEVTDKTITIVPTLSKGEEAIEFAAGKVTASLSPEQGENSEENPLVFTLEEKLGNIKPFSASGVINYNGIEHKFSCDYNAPEKEEAELASCNIELKQDTNETGKISLYPIITFKDIDGNETIANYSSEDTQPTLSSKKKGEKEATDIDNNDFKLPKLKLNWLDLKRLKSESTTKTKDKDEMEEQFAALNDEDEEVEEDEGKKKKKKKADPVSLLEEKFFSLTGVDSEKTRVEGIKAQPTEQIFAVTIKINDLCRKQAKIKIPASTPKADNGNPRYLQNKPGQIRKSSKTIFKGQR